MHTSIRALAIVALMLPLAVGCSRAGRGERMSQAEPPPQPRAMNTPTDAAMPIPGHPPVSTSGVVASFDPSAGIVTFKDGRTFKLTEQSVILQPVDSRALRSGEPIIVRNAMPIGVRSASKASSGKRQRMATVASVDQGNRVVRMTDSTNMHMGADGPVIVLTDLRPGDELVIVMVDDTAATPAKQAKVTPPTGSPSALPREAITGPPDDAAELMVFRNAEAP
jgi:hypothetical protein